MQSALIRAAVLKFETGLVNIVDMNSKAINLY